MSSKLSGIQRLNPLSSRVLLRERGLGDEGFDRGVRGLGKDEVDDDFAIWFIILIYERFH
jgi:hypothetical protein